MNRLFVYGIFLDVENRFHYGMSNPEYAVVPDYVTRQCGMGIVEAVKVDGLGLGLTGFTVDVKPLKWPDIDRLEASYDRIVVRTLDGEDVYMYVAKDQELNEGNTIYLEEEE